MPSLPARVLAGAALAAYLLVLAGSPMGNGWKLIVHLAKSHHGTQTAHAHPPEPDATLPLQPATTGHRHEPERHHEHDQHDARPHESAHSHPMDHDHVHSHEPKQNDHAVSSGDNHAGDHDSPPARNAPHEHSGQVHTHEQQQAPQDVLLVILTLDQHCLFANPSSPTPHPARNPDFVYLPVAPVHITLPTETPPPRRAI